MFTEFMIIRYFLVFWDVFLSYVKLSSTKQQKYFGSEGCCIIAFLFIMFFFIAA